MAKKANPYRPKDTNQLAKYIVDMATGQIPMDNKKKGADSKKAPSKRANKKS